MFVIAQNGENLIEIKGNTYIESVLCRETREELLTDDIKHREVTVKNCIRKESWETVRRYIVNSNGYHLGVYATKEKAREAVVLMGQGIMNNVPLMHMPQDDDVPACMDRIFFCD